MTKEFLERIANEDSKPCVTISMKTHRTFPDCEKDEIRMKNLFKEASERLINEFGKKEIEPILNKMDSILETYDFRHSLDSLHIFLSNSTQEVVKSPWAVDQNKVHISDYFAIKPLIVMDNRQASYLVLLLSKSGIKLFKAESDQIVEEVKNDAFPSNKNPYYVDNKIQGSDAERVDNMVLEYFNTMDKEVVKVHNDTGLQCVVVSTEDNFNKLKKVADKPSVYMAYAPINYNESAEHVIVKSAWEAVQALQKENRTAAIEEMQTAVNKGNVLTDLAEIYRAAKDGRGELLIVHNQYMQAVKMTGEFSFDLIDDVTIPDAIDDISSVIAAEVISKKGRVVFTNQDEIKSLGNIALKLRF